MHPERDVSDMKETCGIHARYMRDTCILRGNQDTCGIHAEYMRDTCGTRISGVWGYPSAAASRARDTYLEVYLDVSHMYLECILCVTYLRVKIHCILNVS